MKHGSLINEIQSRAKQTTVPTEGMGVTVLHYSDREAGTITRVAASGKRFWFRADKTARTDKNGMSESQTYIYAPGNGPEVEVKQGRDGRWRTAGGKKKGYSVLLNVRDAYFDFSY